MTSYFKKYFLLILLLTSVSILHSQERIVTGKVTTLDKIVVANAEVKVLSSKKIVITDINGLFKVKCTPKDKIKISAKGFLSKKINLDKKTEEITVNLKLKPGKKNVDIALGYGHIKEEDKPFSMNRVKNTRGSRFSQYTNMLDVIRDISPSISVKNGEIIIRGEGSLIGSSGALILLNGSPISMSQLPAIEPINVKSVDILTGSSAAVYGVRGANGVVIITTKTGKTD